MNFTDLFFLTKANFGLKISKVLYPKSLTHISDKSTIFIHDSPTKFTREIVQFLKKKNIDVVFLIIGKQIKEDPEILNFIIENGFKVGVHSFAHKRLNYFFNFIEFKEDLEKCEEMIYRRFPNQEKFYTPPFGILSRKAYKYLLSKNYKIVFGERYFDDRKVSLDVLTKKVQKALEQNKSIILHDRERLQELIANYMVNVHQVIQIL